MVAAVTAPPQPPLRPGGTAASPASLGTDYTSQHARRPFFRLAPAVHAGRAVSGQSQCARCMLEGAGAVHAGKGPDLID